MMSKYKRLTERYIDEQGINWNGTLIEIPCKVGDVKLKDLAYIVEDENGDVIFQHITRIFGTEAEAEAKLKELQGKEE